MSLNSIYNWCRNKFYNLKIPGHVSESLAMDSIAVAERELIDLYEGMSLTQFGEYQIYSIDAAIHNLKTWGPDSADYATRLEALNKRKQSIQDDLDRIKFCDDKIWPSGGCGGGCIG